MRSYPAGYNESSIIPKLARGDRPDSGSLLLGRWYIFTFFLLAFRGKYWSERGLVDAGFHHGR